MVPESHGAWAWSVPAAARAGAARAGAVRVGVEVNQRRRGRTGCGVMGPQAAAARAGVDVGPSRGRGGRRRGRGRRWRGEAAAQKAACVCGVCGVRMPSAHDPALGKLKTLKEIKKLICRVPAQVALGTPHFAECRPSCTQQIFCYIISSSCKNF